MGDDDKSMQRQMKADLTAQLLAAANTQGGGQKTGRIVNDFGQEEAGISRRDAKRSALRDMYANSTESKVHVPL
eukprot:CAMPEP_0114134948 /NCGR_PEP_ID=MMETSP0043_2-20121206/14443_1 /TAXON_ID=464988 /ORGANISM="Hemiselmis andersenii, Strain CCMP644" /LENGTH=73 /DNA_ID=CAMNT_0001228649 /DNA_START=51 /DNA_END=269 /DNA_ORIENTATION=-